MIRAACKVEFASLIVVVIIRAARSFGRKLQSFSDNRVVTFLDVFAAAQPHLLTEVEVNVLQSSSQSSVDDFLLLEIGANEEIGAIVPGDCHAGDVTEVSNCIEPILPLLSRSTTALAELVEVVIYPFQLTTDLVSDVRKMLLDLLEKKLAQSGSEAVDTLLISRKVTPCAFRQEGCFSFVALCRRVALFSMGSVLQDVPSQTEESILVTDEADESCLILRALLQSIGLRQDTEGSFILWVYRLCSLQDDLIGSIIL